MSYEYKRFGNLAILKDGHTMFIDDVVSDLNRKSFVEGLLIEQNKIIADLKIQLANSIPKERVEGAIESLKIKLTHSSSSLEEGLCTSGVMALESILSSQPINQGEG